MRLSYYKRLFSPHTLSFVIFVLTAFLLNSHDADELFSSQHAHFVYNIWLKIYFGLIYLCRQMDKKRARAQQERTRESASCLCSILVWAFPSCFKGHGPVPVCSNNIQMDGHVTATEVACCLQTNNTVLSSSSSSCSHLSFSLFIFILKHCFFSALMTHFSLVAFVCFAGVSSGTSQSSSSLTSLSLPLMCSDLQTRLLSGSTAH